MPHTSTFIDAIFATRCLLCHSYGASCCHTCWQSLGFEQRAVLRSSPLLVEFKNPAGTVPDGKAPADTVPAGKAPNATLQGISMIDFNPQVAALMHAYKELGRSALAAQFASAMVPGVQALSRRSAGVQAADSAGTFATQRPTFLVPVPSQQSSIQDRGYSPAGLIVRQLVGLLEPRFGFSPRNYFGGQTLLRRVVESKDQAGLTQQDRLQNLHETMQSSKRAAGKRVILVDDIVTTGSSLLESARALTAAGAQVIGFLTFAETILRKIAKTHTS